MHVVVASRSVALVAGEPVCVVRCFNDRGYLDSERLVIVAAYYRSAVVRDESDGAEMVAVVEEVFGDGGFRSG
jgi:hypothetical protein